MVAEFLLMCSNRRSHIRNELVNMITGVLTLPFANSLHSRPYLRLTFPQRNDFTGLTLIIDAESPVPICVDGGLYKPAPLPLDIDLKASTSAKALDAAGSPGLR